MQQHYRVGRVAEMLSIPERSLRKLIANGRLQVVRVAGSRTVLIPEAALDSLLGYKRRSSHQPKIVTA